MPNEGLDMYYCIRQALDPLTALAFATTLAATTFVPKLRPFWEAPAGS